ncbi:MAG TPA: DUF6491 family protein [Allosphingosinicella sp.]|nr:DUF6491 family protein [Allosphingosinicella sp.]
MKRRGSILVFALAGCAAGGSIDDRESSALARQLAERVAGEPDRCVSRIGSTSLHPVDRRTLVYDTPGTLWVNRLRAECPGLRPDSLIVIEASGESYCRNDRFRAVERGSSIPGPTCLLGDFTPYRRR